MELSKDAVEMCVLTIDFVYAFFGMGIIYNGLILEPVEKYPVMRYVIIAIGILVILLATIGVLGSIHESDSTLSFILSTLLAIIIVKIVVLVILITPYMHSHIAHIANAHFDKLWPYKDTPILQPENDNGPLAQIEKLLYCCGKYGPADYFEPPKSCLDSDDLPYLRGCAEKYVEYSFNQYKLLEYILFGLIILETISAVFSGLYARKIYNMYTL